MTWVFKDSRRSRPDRTDNIRFCASCSMSKSASSDTLGGYLVVSEIDKELKLLDAKERMQCVVLTSQ